RREEILGVQVLAARVIQGSLGGRKSLTELPLLQEGDGQPSRPDGELRIFGQRSSEPALSSPWIAPLEGHLAEHQEGPRASWLELQRGVECLLNLVPPARGERRGGE